jgi:hypothetical protein
VDQLDRNGISVPSRRRTSTNIGSYTSK